MGDDALCDSFASGPHAALASLVGKWAGTARTWLTPGELVDGSETTGSIGVLLDGRTFEAVAEDDLVISHFDIPPGGPEYLGVETRDRRVV